MRRKRPITLEPTAKKRRRKSKNPSHCHSPNLYLVYELRKASTIEAVASKLFSDFPLSLFRLRQYFELCMCKPSLTITSML